MPACTGGILGAGAGSDPAFLCGCPAGVLVMSYTMVRIRTFLALLAVVVAFSVPGAAGAQAAGDDAKRGMADYQAHCLQCHGAKGKGDGRVMDMQHRRLPDLSRLSLRNQGVFPKDRVMEIIDGTGVIVIHGTSGMPVWGTRMREEAAKQCKSSGCNADSIVRERLRALADYIALLQEK